MSTVKQLKVKLFADGADIAGMKEMAANPLIKGMALATGAAKAARSLRHK